MNPSELLIDAFERIVGVTDRAVSGLTPEQLRHRPSETANSIGWLVWHLTRIQDDHVADAAGSAQLWEQGWRERFALPYDDDATGYAQTSADVAAFEVPSGQLLLDYLQAVHERTVEFLGGLDADALDRVVDTNWDPPVTLGVRLISVIGDDLQHAGQAAYVRGLLG